MKPIKQKMEGKPALSGLMEQFFGKKASKEDDMAMLPSVNISENDNSFDVSVAVPGFDKNDIKVDVVDNCLVISSEKEFDKKENNKKWVRHEYGYTSFERVFELPESADPESIQAEMKHGILKIRISKKPGYESRRKVIEVQ
jgi:HSP20 family protein